MKVRGIMKILKLFLITLFIFSSSISFASDTSVTGTIQDPTGQVYANGTVRANFRPDPTKPPGTVYTSGGVPFPQIVTGVLDATGTFTILVTDYNSIDPPNTSSTWVFTFCSNTTAPCMVSAPLKIEGATQNISSVMNAQVPVIKITASASPAYAGVAYLDGEVVNPITGTFYTNSIVNSLRVYDAVTGTWSAGVGGGVTSAFGRTGAVVSVTGDYTVGQVTNALDITTFNDWTQLGAAPAAPAAGKLRIYARSTDFLCKKSPSDVESCFGSTSVPQVANTVLAGPTSGPAGSSGFRALVSADIPLIGIAQGGTGQTTSLAAFNALSPLTTTGDMLTRNSTDNIRLPIGLNGQCLTSNGTQPVWATCGAGGAGWVYSTPNKRWELFDATILTWLVGAKPSWNIEANFGSQSSSFTTTAQMAIGNHGWLTVSSGPVTVTPGGGYRITTSTVLNNSAYICSAALGSCHFPLPAGNLDSFMLTVNTVQDAADTNQRVGFWAGVGTPTPTTGIYVESLAADTNWFLVARSSSVETRCNTGVAHAAGTVSFVVVKNATTSLTVFTPGTGTALCTVTTNIPASGVNLGAFTQVFNSGTTAQAIEAIYFLAIGRIVGY